MSTKLQGIFANIVTLCKDLASNAEQIIKEHVIDALDELDKILQGTISPCIEQARTKLDAVKKEALKNLLDCTDKLAQSIQQIKDNVQKDIKSIEEKISSIKNKAFDCLKKPAIGTQVQCMAELIPEATTKINQIIINDVPKIISGTTSQLLSIQNQSRESILVILQKSRAEIKKILKEVPGCIIN